MKQMSLKVDYVRCFCKYFIDIISVERYKDFKLKTILQSEHNGPHSWMFSTTWASEKIVGQIHKAFLSESVPS